MSEKHPQRNAFKARIADFALEAPAHIAGRPGAAPNNIAIAAFIPAKMTVRKYCPENRTA